MDQKDLTRIKSFAQSNPGDFYATLNFTGKEADQDFILFCDELTGALPGLEIARKRDDNSDVPSIHLDYGIDYQAIPLGAELNPFLTALSFTRKQNQADAFHAPGPESAEKLSVPAFLKLFITPFCPHCPGFIMSLIPLVHAHAHIELRIIDGIRFEQAAQTEQVKSVPTLILDRQFRWTGMVSNAELLQILENRNPLSLSSDSIQNMIQQGDASKVAQLMIEHNDVIPGFFDVLIHDKWPVRLGAMVVMEELIESRIEMARKIIDAVWDKLEGVEDQVLGDVIYLLGQAGDKRYLSNLESLSGKGYNPEIQAIIQEAIQTIQNNSR